jgi:tryptophan synthase alpha subunit
VARLADGVVVGSALVDALGSGGVAAARRFLQDLRRGLDPAPALA